MISMKKTEIGMYFSSLGAACLLIWIAGVGNSPLQVAPMELKQLSGGNF